MKFLKKIAALFAAAVTAVSASAAAFAEFPSPAEKKGVAVIHVNDVHCDYKSSDKTFGYAELAAYRAKLEAEGWDTVLADAGDYLQGSPLGTLSKGAYVADIMNAVGFDVAAVGNHDLDFGADRLAEIVEKLDCAVISANFTYSDSGKRVFSASYVNEKLGVGFVGLTTPNTIMSFRSQKDSDKYDFENDPAKLWKIIQNEVDELKARGVKTVIALTHLGTLESLGEFRSYNLIANTTGINAVIDGHSHTVNCETVKNKNGEDVILAQTGVQMLNIGTIFITEDGISSKLTPLGEYSVPKDENSAEFKEFKRINDVIEGIESNYGELVNTVVAKTEYDLRSLDPESHYEWLVRVRETNAADLCADAYRWALGADIGLINGGGVRADIEKGDITYGNIISVQPFGNSLCKSEITGQILLDALEMGARSNPTALGGFLQVSGVSYEIHNYIPSSVKRGENGEFLGVEGEYRVKNVKVNGEPLVLDKKYTVASHAYMLKNGGDGFVMFNDGTLLEDEVALDNQVLINYITEALGGVIGDEYADMYGTGRITICSEVPASPDTGTETFIWAAPLAALAAVTLIKLKVKI